MTIKEFLTETDSEVAATISPDFTIRVMETESVPSFDETD